jgi:hypothetical protein
MLLKITGYTAIIEMIKNANAMNAESLNPVSLLGKTEDRIMVIINTILTTIKYIQPVVIFFSALRHN